LDERCGHHGRTVDEDHRSRYGGLLGVLSVKKVLPFVKRNAWTAAFFLVMVVNLFIFQRYEALNDDFKQSLTESCENRKTARDAYRFIILTVIEGHPRESELREYTEENLPPVEC
jgi:hypothetical protein